MRIFRYSAPVVAATISFGCGTFTTQTRSTVRQSGIVPGPTAPLIAGSGMEDNKWSVAASAQGGLRGTSRPYQNGRPTLGIADTGGRVAVGYNGKGWGLAAGVELRPSALVHADSGDSLEHAFGTEPLVIPTLAARFRPVQTEIFELGLITEISATTVPYARSVETSTVTTSSSGTSSPTFTQDAEMGHVTAVMVRAGPSFGWKLGYGVAITAGFLVGNQPYFEPETTVSRTCTTSGWNTDCTGSTADDVATMSQSIAMVPFLSPSVTIGPVQIVGQFFGNFSSSQEVTEISPGGGELQVRMMF